MGNEFAPDNGLKTRESDHLGIDEQSDPCDELKKRVNTTIYNIEVPVDRWLEYSNKDMEAMEHMAKHERFDLALFFLQQSLEKSLKAVWSDNDKLRKELSVVEKTEWGRGDKPKIVRKGPNHGLFTLAMKGKIPIPHESDELKKFFRTLSSCYFDRYPDKIDEYGKPAWKKYPWTKYKKETYENYLDNGHYTQGLIYVKLNKLKELDELLGKMRGGKRKEELEKTRSDRRKAKKPPSDDSMAELSALWQKKKKDSMYYARLAKQLFEAGMPDTALENLRKAIRLAPEYRKDYLRKFGRYLK
jgi:tetratricopeptide (TPR) repeat protein